MADKVRSELSRELSLLHITLMGVGMMIGAGVFVATGIGIGLAGPGGILLAFSLNGLLAFLSVMTYAELSSAIPRAGGGYAYVQHCIGGFTGFIAGWISWFAHAVAGSLYAITFAKYTLHFILELTELKFLSDNLFYIEKATALAVAFLFLYINYRGASETGSVGAVITIGQTAVLLIIGLAGIVVALANPGRMANFSPFLPNGWGKVLVVMGFSLVGYEGYEVITNTSEEAIDAKKNVPRAIFLAVIIVITTYILVAFAAVVAVSVQEGSVSSWFAEKGATGFAEAVSRLFPFGNVLVVLAAVFASTSALNATIYSSTRVSFSLGRDGYLPAVFGRISPARRIPHVALFFSGLIILTVAALLPVEIVMAGSSIFFIILFTMVTFTVIRVRKEQGDELHYGYMIPHFPLIPILSICGMLLIGIFLFDMGAEAYIIAGGWLGAGLLLYRYYGKAHMKRSDRAGDLHVGFAAEEESGKSIMVCAGNPENLTSLLKYASLLKEDNETILVNHVVTVPYQTPISQSGQSCLEGVRLLEESLVGGEGNGAVRGVVSCGHNVARSLIQSVREKNPRLLVLGWRGFTEKRHFSLGSTLDPLIELAPSDILVIKAAGAKEDRNRPIGRILYPSRGKSPHSRLAVDMVNSLGDALGADVTFFHVYPRNRKHSEPGRDSKVLNGEFHNSIHTIKIIEHNDVVKAILEEAENHDLLILGASSDNPLRRKLFGTIPEKIARGCTKPVLMVKQNRGIRPWLDRWLL